MHDLAGPGWLCAEPCPVVHEPPSAVEQIASLICPHHGIADRMSQRQLAHFKRVIRSLGSPLREGAAHPVHRLLPAKAMQLAVQSVMRQRSALVVARE